MAETESDSWRSKINILKFVQKIKGSIRFSSLLRPLILYVKSQKTTKIKRIAELIR